MKAQPMKVVFPFSQVVFVLTVVVSTILETSLSSGVLPSTALTTPGTAACTAPVAMSTGSSASTTISRPVPLFVASGIDYLSI